MQDRKALQAGTSHFLGQNFAHAQEIKFQDQAGAEQYAWTTSWGVSTRLVGALLMTHSDDDGLILPPKLAPRHVVLLPIYRNDEERAQVLRTSTASSASSKHRILPEGKVRVLIDNRDIRGGEKAWYHIKRGVPIRAEVGPKDIAQQAAFVARRDTGEKLGTPRSEFVAKIGRLLDEIQTNLFQRALSLRQEHTRSIDNLDDFRAYFTPQNEDQPEIHAGFAMCHFVDEPRTQEILKDLKVTIRCIPLAGPAETGRCIFTGQPSSQRAVFAKAY